MLRVNIHTCKAIYSVSSIMAGKLGIGNKARGACSDKSSGFPLLKTQAITASSVTDVFSNLFSAGDYV